MLNKVFRFPRTILQVVILGPLAVLYSSAMHIRNRLYESGRKSSFAAGCPVLSVGNLTAGGTGKTPITSFLIDSFQRRGINVGVISRGYGGTSRGPERVLSDGSSESAKRFGDEPAWLAMRHSDTPIFIGRNKVAVAQELLRQSKVSLIIADDAFQHRRLKRNCEVVLVDATEPRSHYFSLPLGRMRDPLTSLNRADYVFITKTNLAGDDQLGWIRKKIAEHKKTSRFKVFEFEVAITGFFPIQSASNQTSSEPVKWQKPEGVRALLVSGIGRPQTFADLVALSGVEVLDQLAFDDHHAYSENDLLKIEKHAESMHADAIIVTEKDAIKLTTWRPKIPVMVSRLVARPCGDLKEFYASVDRILL